MTGVPGVTMLSLKRMSSSVILSPPAGSSYDCDLDLLRLDLSLDVVNEVDAVRTVEVAATVTVSIFFVS